MHINRDEVVAEDASYDRGILLVRRQVVRCQLKLVPLKITLSQCDKLITLRVHNRDHVSAQVDIPDLALEVEREVRLALKHRIWVNKGA